MNDTNEKLPFFKPILSGRLPNFGDHNTKVVSNIEWKCKCSLFVHNLVLRNRLKSSILYLTLFSSHSNKSS